MDEIPSYLTELQFPSFAAILAEVSEWKGLPSHFVNLPNYVPQTYTVLKQYNINNDITIPDPPTILMG